MRNSFLVGRFSKKPRKIFWGIAAKALPRATRAQIVSPPEVTATNPFAIAMVAPN